MNNNTFEYWIKHGEESKRKREESRPQREAAYRIKWEEVHMKLREDLNTFFNDAKYIKKGSKFDEILQRKKYLSYIMFTGSSGAGKTTQVTNIYDLPNNMDTARNYAMFGGDSIYYTIAPRYITRKSRDSDNKTGLVENINVESREKFQELVENDVIGIWRERDLGSEKVLYGFRSNRALSGDVAKKRRKAKAEIGVDGPNRVRRPEQGGIIIYSGNNDMARNFDDIPFCAQHKDEFVHIHVQAQDNTDRFIQRSNDVATSDKKQLEKRASDGGLDVLAKAHIVINNEPGQQKNIDTELEHLMKIMAKYNEDTYEYNPQYTSDEISKAINPGFSRGKAA